MAKTKTKGSPWYRHPSGVGWKCRECGRCNSTKVRKCSKCRMPKVVIDSSGKYITEADRDKAKGQPETVTVEEWSLPAGHMEVPEVQGGEREENEDMPEVRGET